MADKNGMPEAEGQVADAYEGNWVDHYAPKPLRPYLRLSRADRPIGTWLLLLPCFWGLLAAMAHSGRASWHDAWIALGCTAGAFLMRGAGCTWNDISDRHYDAQVARTKSRPIPSGQVSVPQALGWLVIQALLSFFILISFYPTAIWLGVVALIPVVIYPFAKRFTWWPQVFLGIAFNWGALLAYAAHSDGLGWPAVALYFAGMAWTLFYDTIYAHQDKEDDALIGVKSTARRFGEKTPRYLLVFLIIAVALMTLGIALAFLPHASPVALIVALAGPWALGWHLSWQLRVLDMDDPENCLKLFRSNRNAGLLPVPFLAVALFL